mmetsp:Transcript_19322/g.17138  ORF Transcript_19322/g.17138 Transcript_19322/m.17138 type:complete len:114 (-) Transcript_19322:36-377(-)
MNQNHCKNDRYGKANILIFLKYSNLLKLYFSINLLLCIFYSKLISFPNIPIEKSIIARSKESLMNLEADATLLAHLRNKINAKRRKLGRRLKYTQTKISFPKYEKSKSPIRDF